MTAAPATRVPPCAARTTCAPVVAMVGAGQLARMTHQAAIGLGVELRVLAGDESEAAVRAGAHHVIGDPDRLADLRTLAAGADVLTFDHERIDPRHLAVLAEEGAPLAPSASAKLLAQDKLHARRTLGGRGFPIPPFVHARTPTDVEAFAAHHGWPLVGKAPRGGYDGRGVFPLAGPSDVVRVLADLPDGMLLEPHLEIERELAVIVARSTRGESVAYPVVETVQRDGMCREIVAPAPVGPALAAEARDLAHAIADEIGATGLLAVELFVTPAGLVLNELALRPHNSGHYTIEGCVTSQFAQHVRAVLGWPLGSSALRSRAVVTVNVVGPDDGTDPRDRLAAALEVCGAHVHLYGKPARPGRKLGHVTVCGEYVAPARDAARRAVAILEGRRS